MRELAPKYDPKEVEERLYAHWETQGYFKADPKSAKTPFSIVMPPPNVTGSLHIGHALDNSIPDLYVRYQRMKGLDALWVPGCDHAGIATQNVVERELAKEGKSRESLGREAFLERVWKWKEEYGSTIMRQLRRLGASCDWSYERFTMDPGLSQAVQEVFIRLFDKGLIYQGDYIINWCPRCGTALSDIEAPHKDSDGKLYYVRYPVKGQPGRFVVVATTRPETIPGDVAVCVNPKDERFGDLKGATLILPLLKRELPLIADSYVDMSFGTGALKITPAHDLNDFEIGNKYGLPRIKIMDPKGVLNEEAGPYRGLDRFAARKRIVEDLEAQGLLEKVEDYKHAVARCYRCDTVVESYLSLQWFVNMKPMAEKALQALQSGQMKFQPENWSKVYSDWLLAIRPWCISRQIWWGHRIPVYYNADRSKRCAARSLSEAAQKLGLKESELTQDADVLDTWFSSGLWPFSTMGWPETTLELKRYYPTSLLVTSWDILFFWVARMSMFGLEIMGEVPFREVFIHSLVTDEHGQKMSKSKGNVIDPMSKIDSIGADALRFALYSIETQSRYISLSQERLDSARNFMNKIWNAARFMLLNLQGFSQAAPTRPHGAELELPDLWILSRAEVARQGVERFLEEGRQVNHAANLLYDFFWNEFCGWYIEAVKGRLQSEGASKRSAQACLLYVLERSLRLLHPFCPFISEEIWQLLPGAGPSIMLSAWPQSEGSQDAQVEKDFQVLCEVVYAVRNLRAEMRIEPKAKVKLLLQCADSQAQGLLETQKAFLEGVGQFEITQIGAKLLKPKGAASAVAGSVEVFMPLEGLLDPKLERQRLEKEIAKYKSLSESLAKKLENEAFVAKAPKELVLAERRKIEEYGQAIEKLDSNLKAIAS